LLDRSGEAFKREATALNLKHPAMRLAEVQETIHLMLQSFGKMQTACMKTLNVRRKWPILTLGYEAKKAQKAVQRRTQFVR
jgi:hypothetical protein